MEVWDPKDKITVLSQIKKAIGARYQGFKPWVVCLYPGNLIKKAKDALCEEFYANCEYYGGKISTWARRKRWDRDKK